MAFAATASWGMEGDGEERCNARAAVAEGTAKCRGSQISSRGTGKCT